MRKYLRWLIRVSVWVVLFPAWCFVMPILLVVFGAMLSIYWAFDDPSQFQIEKREVKRILESGTINYFDWLRLDYS